MLDAALEERIREGFVAFFAGDLDRAVALFAEDVIGVDAPEMPDAGVLHGRESVKARLAGFRELFDDFVMRDISFEELAGRALVVIHVHARSRATALDVDFELAYLFTFHDGIATEIRSFLTEAHAREFAATG